MRVFFISTNNIAESNTSLTSKYGRYFLTLFDLSGFSGTSIGFGYFPQKIF
jgi:hypothetical protein